ncbi:type II secretion system protein GspK [Methylopila sp. 73B]|uniref:general secretion pathway protein GspK n=1 Tax=Methylopila sp. 73B TaxID=1120792 RepID=UPI00036F7C3B|nr:type II secretion system protein GspK [Methylopila sp. 73B]
MRGGRDGFVLVSALAVLAVLAAVVVGASVLVRSSVAEARLARDRLTEDALVHAGLEFAAYQLVALRRPPSELAGQRLRLDAGVVTLSAAAEAGKVDLNGADPKLLAGLWRALGLTSMTAETFADRVVDWRDPDGKRGRLGAERREYGAAGLPGPADDAFATVDDVRNVLGVGVAEARALKPFLTVANPRGRVSALEAPPEVLRATPGLGRPVIDQILSLRRRGAASMEAVQQLLGGGSTAPLGAFYGPAFRVEIAIEDARRRPARAYEILKGEGPRLFWVLREER